MVCLRRLTVAGDASDLMLRHLAAKCAEQRVSWAFLVAGETLRNIATLPPPEREDFRSIVSLLFRYGT